MAHGIAVAGPGIGVAVALPVAAGLIETAGWRSASLAFLGASLAGVVFVWLMTSGPAIIVPARGSGGRTRAKEAELAARPARLGRRVVGIVAAAVVGGGVLLAFGASSAMPAVAVAGIVLHGIGSGATIAVRSAAFSDVFEGPSFGTIFGLLAVAYPIGGAIAVYTGALASDQLGAYAPLVALVIVAPAGWGVA